MRLCRNARTLCGSPQRRRQTGHSRSRPSSIVAALSTFWCSRTTSASGGWQAAPAAAARRALHTTGARAAGSHRRSRACALRAPRAPGSVDATPHRLGHRLPLQGHHRRRDEAFRRTSEGAALALPALTIDAAPSSPPPRDPAERPPPVDKDRGTARADPVKGAQRRRSRGPLTGSSTSSRWPSSTRRRVARAGRLGAAPCAVVLVTTRISECTACAAPLRRPARQRGPCAHA